MTSSSGRQTCCWKSSSYDQLDGCLLWTLAPELLFAVVANLDGRGLSALCEALLASKRHRILFSPLFYHVMCRWQDETVDLLSNKIANPQPALVSFVKDSLVPRSAAFYSTASSLGGNAPDIIRNVSEWCILLDYVLEGPRSAASLRSGFDDDSVDRMVWPIGVGVFVTSTACSLGRPVSTKVIVHCPVWDPAAVMVCHDTWLPPSQMNNKATNKTISTKLVKGSPTHFAWLPSEGDIDGFSPDENIGILTPFDETNERTFRATQGLTRADDFLPAMGRPDSCLTILPAQDCPIYGSLVDHLIRSSRHHSWMLDRANDACAFAGTKVPAMLCFFDNHSTYTETWAQRQGGEGSLVDLIMRLMKTCRTR